MKKILLFLTVTAMILCTIPFGTVFAVSENDESILSPALKVIANRYSMSVSVGAGEEISFSPSVFDLALGVNKVSEITVKELPPLSSGTLMLGNLRVMKEQKIPRSSLKDLRFITLNGVEKSSFVFSFGNGGYDIKCNMYITDKENYAPTSLGVDENFFTVSTYKNIAVKSTMSALDPEGDELVFEIKNNTKKGLLTLLNRNTGEYVYTPLKNFSGNDSFTYTVTDKYGNCSKEMTVNIKVRSSKDGNVYYDMIGDYSHYGAIKLTDKGIMESYEDSKGLTFMPDKEMSSLDFLVAAMKTLGIDINDAAIVNVFEGVSSEYISYVSRAYEMGVITNEGENAFYADKALSLGDACVIICSLMNIDGADTLPAFKDESDIPDHAYDAVCALAERNIVFVDNGEVNADENLTRGDCARLLSKLI